MSELLEPCWFKKSAAFLLEWSSLFLHATGSLLFCNGEVIPATSEGDLRFEREVDVRLEQFLGCFGECWEDSRTGTDPINTVLSMSEWVMRVS